MYKNIKNRNKKIELMFFAAIVLIMAEVVKLAIKIVPEIEWAGTLPAIIEIVSFTFGIYASYRLRREHKLFYWAIFTGAIVIAFEIVVTVSGFPRNDIAWLAILSDLLPIIAILCTMKGIIKVMDRASGTNAHFVEHSAKAFEAYLEFDHLVLFISILMTILFRERFPVFVDVCRSIDEMIYFSVIIIFMVFLFVCTIIDEKVEHYD